MATNVEKKQKQFLRSNSKSQELLIANTVQTNDDEGLVNYYYTEEYEIDPDFVRKYIDYNDELDDYKLNEYRE